jgi:hypothetical protein
MPGGGSARSPGDGPAAGPRPAQAAATSGKSMSTDLGSTGSGCEGGPHSVQIAIPYGNCVQRFPKGARRGRQGGAKDPLPPPCRRSPGADHCDETERPCTVWGVVKVKFTGLTQNSQVDPEV